MQLRSVLAVGLLFAMLVGCGGNVGGSFQQKTGTEVMLRGNNYKVLKAGARGESTGFYLFGFIPIVRESFADAKSDLYQSVGVPLEGRSVALANQTEDRSGLYLFLFSLPKLTISADIVEFNGTPSEAPSK